MESVVVATADPQLLDELLRHSAAAGVQPEVVGSAAEVSATWRRGAAVLVGTDLAPALVPLGPPRRRGVHLVGMGGSAPPALGYEWAVALGAESVIDLPERAAELGGLLGDLVDPARELAPVVGVVAGTGGAGASTLACAVAQCVGRRSGSGVLLVDLDPAGAGLDRVLGVEESARVGWESLAASAGRLSAKALATAVPRRNGVGVLTWEGLPAPVPAGCVRQALEAAVRGHDLVLVDLPRDRGLEAAVARVDRVLVVARPDLTGLAGAGRLVARLPRHRVDVVLRGAASATVAVDVVTDRPVLARMRDQRGVTESVDLGLGPLRGRRGPLASAAGLLAAELLGPTHEE